MSHRSKKFTLSHQEANSSTTHKSIKSKPIKKISKISETKPIPSRIPLSSKKKPVIGKDKNSKPKPVLYNRLDYKNYKQNVLKLFKLLNHDLMKMDMDFMRNENFFNLVSFITKLKSNPMIQVSFEEECQKIFEKKIIIKNNEQNHKKLEAMKIFIKIYNSLKKIVNSWDSDQQIKSLTRKFKLTPNFFSKIYHSIEVSSETLNLPNSSDLKRFEERSKVLIDEHEEENDLDLYNKDILFYLDSTEEKGVQQGSDNSEIDDMKKKLTSSTKSNKSRSEYKKENSLMDIVDFIFLLAKADPSLQNSLTFLNKNSNRNPSKYEFNQENEENSSISPEISLNFSENDNNGQEKLLENLLNEKNINYSNLINKILMPISKKIIGLIGDFTLAYSRLKEILKRKEMAQKKKASFAMKNIIISPPINENQK